jgi:hypothetical protein
MLVMDETPGRVPDEAAILYVLAAPQPGAGAPAYLLHEVGGVSCVIAYTDLARLVECCGEYQPWLGIEIAALMLDLREQGLPGPVVNLPLNPALWWTADGPPYEMPVPDRPAVDLADTRTTTAKGWFA